MFCTKCGQQNAENAKFCYNCGNVMTGAPVGQRPINQDIYRTQYVQHPVSLQPSVCGIIFSVLMMISCFLPFVGSKWFGESQNFASINPGFGIAVLGVSIIALIFSILNKRSGIIISGVCGIAGVAAQFIYWVIELKNAFGRYSDVGEIMEYLLKFYEYKVGFWGVVICSIAVIITGTSTRDQRNHYEEGHSNADLINRLKYEDGTPGLWTCFLCGTQNAMYTGTCKCGNNITDPRNKVARPSSNTSGNTMIKCSSCGNMVRGDRISCTICGSKLIK